ncbi:MAG: arylsulfotransferase family protein [Thalassobaculum sp.]|uniref:arylsulfotransferase family protein n=1 Tax=Thalassobaculum sp. TaxID=2022740 RepID=UPI0032ED0CB1
MSFRTDGYPDQADPGVDRALRVLSFAGLAILLFLGGALIAIVDVFPSQLLKDAYSGGVALYSRWTQYQDVTRTDLWQPARTDARGVTVNQAGRIQPGYTLYSSGHEAAAFLMAADGTVVHAWRRPYSSVWTSQSPVRDPLPDRNVYFRKVEAFPNGDLLALYEGAGDTPYGYGMVMLDRESGIRWRYFGHAHHDFDIDRDGRIYVLTQESRSKPMARMDHLAKTRLDDFLDILSPDGVPLRRVSLLEALARSRFEHLIYTVPAPSVGDPLHTNTLKVLTPEMAAALPGTAPGQVLLSFRDIGAVAVLDLEREEIVWALRGPWYGQHDPDLLPNGNLLVFDNLGAFRNPGGRTRVIEVDPRSGAVMWRYQGTAERPLESEIRGDQQRLANGNTLINESSGGRILEVTPAGEVVWEYVNPERTGDRDQWIPIVASARRLRPEFEMPGSP